MRIEEIVVADDTPATPTADGQGANAGDGSTPPAGGATVPGADDGVVTGELTNDATVNALPESELNKDLEEVEGEYGPPAEAITEAGEALEEVRAEETDAHETIMALEGYFLLTKQTIENKTCSLESLQLIRLGIEPYLKDGKFVTMAMEGREGAGIELQHQLALEGIKEAIKSHLHSVHTAHSASIDNIKMIFTSIESDVKRYEAGLKKALEKFEAFIKDDPKKELHLDLHVLHNFFNISGKEASKALGAILREDEKFDTYVLTKYSVEVDKQLEGFGNAIASEKTFAGLLSKVLKLKHPIELFDKRALGDERNTPMLGGYYAYIYQSSVMGFSEDKYAKKSRLDQLASGARVVIRQAEGNARRALNNSLNPIAFSVEGGFSEVLKVTPQQIKEVGAAAAQYLKNIEFFLQVMKNSSRAHDQIFEKFLNYEAEDVNHDQADQLFDYFSALEIGVSGTCRQEVTRALKAVFYCIALINRATYVNK